VPASPAAQKEEIDRGGKKTRPKIKGGSTEIRLGGKKKYSFGEFWLGLECTTSAALPRTGSNLILGYRRGKRKRVLSKRTSRLPPEGARKFMFLGRREAKAKSTSTLSSFLKKVSKGETLRKRGNAAGRALTTSSGKGVRERVKGGGEDGNQSSREADC